MDSGSHARHVAEEEAQRRAGRVYDLRYGVPCRDRIALHGIALPPGFLGLLAVNWATS
ncbi:hypothetical protein J2Z21_001284 [Streptomyces griseochromogenes]|uniref:Uncharacterized protein n=1 Tax=Streptomyces griseochromogenes TaxID=68214 RepID=A0ABS4LLU8_9ACTN|nr:hypothetical protein [Streptomyces griseochromogenes]MBP2048360.1 hypothetical protein [Streptomyces griseochromogenes]